MQTPCTEGVEQFQMTSSCDGDEGVSSQVGTASSHHADNDAGASLARIIPHLSDQDAMSPSSSMSPDVLDVHDSSEKNGRHMTQSTIHSAVMHRVDRMEGNRGPSNGAGAIVCVSGASDQTAQRQLQPWYGDCLEVAIPFSAHLKMSFFH